MRLRVLVLAAALLVPAIPARAYVPEKTPHRAAEHAARVLVSQPPAHGARPGIVIMRGGREIFADNAAERFEPASIIKLATTTTALIHFGTTHRFATRAMFAGGTLYLVGGGDPTLSTDTYRRNRFLPKSTDLIKRPAFASGSPTIEQLANGIVRSGIRALPGGVVGDDTLFDASRTQAGWLARYFDNDPETGYLSALTVNEGYTDLKQHHIYSSPANAAAQALATALRARGVVITGSVRTGGTPPGVREVGRVYSPPLAEIVDFTLRYSINFDAEMLLKSIGSAFAGSGSTAAGVRVIRSTLQSIGVPTSGLTMTDGSGLSVLDRVTPRTIALLLQKILSSSGPVWDALRSSIPVAGEPGTLQKRMLQPPTRDNLRGKTGQIPNVRAMAGWVTPQDGVPIVYVAMFNGLAKPLALTGPLDLFGFLLANLPGA